MALTFQEIICEAGKLVNEISSQENVADSLIYDIQRVSTSVESMKQYEDDLETLNTEANQKPRQEVVTEFQKGIGGYFRELQAENKDLKRTLEDYQKAIELIMSKYRQQSAYFLKQMKNQNVNVTSNAKTCAQCSQCKCVNVIDKQAKIINEMAAVMRTAAEADEFESNKYFESIGQLKKECSGLREIISIVHKYGNNINDHAPAECKTIQTD